MENNEEILNEMEENVKEETAIAKVQGFGAMTRKSKTKADIFTNITDQKKIFNLDSKVDALLNDCEGEMIKVKEVLIKRYEKPLSVDKIEYDEETGEIKKDKEISMACILIDNHNKSYATGSKVFTIQMMRYIDMFGIAEEGFDIKIIKTKQKLGSSLGFELV